MLLGGLPFTLYLMLARFRQRTKIDPQIRVFLILIAVATGLLLLARPGEEAHSFESFSIDLFNVISIMTTTGFVADDYSKWGGLSVPLFFDITFFGGCAGSTAGGLKAYRLLVSLELVRASLRHLSHPNGVFIMRYGTRPVEPAVFRAAMVMVAAFVATMAAMTVALGYCGLDFLTAMSGSVTALANVGPGLGDIIGPAGTFAPLPDSAKLILSAGMILGRLEILAVLVLFSPPLWWG
jgi:trk system potassium uptake protein TrkH